MRGLRVRDTENIRRDAITTAIKKASEGCRDCSVAYFALARQNGATEQEIEQAVSSTTAPNPSGISRRDLLKLAAGALAGLTGLGLSDSGMQPQAALANSFWWGTDTNTMRLAGTAPPQNFYIGRTGGGTSAGGGGFNTQAATLAGIGYTYSFWDIEGPTMKPGGTSDYNWGYNQAVQAINAWDHGTYASYLGGQTIFGDIEGQNGGWLANNYGPNQQVLQGWLDAIKTYQNLQLFTNGIYISAGQWVSYFGTSYRPSRNFVWWQTGCQTGSGTGSASPCTPPTSGTESWVMGVVNNGAGKNVIGGSQVVLIQYWIDNGSQGCGDYDVAMQDPYNFGWVNSNTNYSCSNCGSSVCP